MRTAPITDVAARNQEVSKMRRWLVIGGLTVLATATTSVGLGAINLNSSKSNTYRDFPHTLLGTASTELVGPNQTQTVFTTPTRGDYILTQFCGSPVSGGIRLDGTGLGGIAHTAQDPCVTFTPGAILPKGAAINCSTSSAAPPGSHFCSITGVTRP